MRAAHSSIRGSFLPIVVCAAALTQYSTALSRPVTSSILRVDRSSRVSIKSAICMNLGGTTLLVYDLAKHNELAHKQL